MMRPDSLLTGLLKPLRVPKDSKVKVGLRGADPGNNPVITVNFGKKTCKECPARSLCTRICELSEIFNLTPPQEQQQALQQARRRQTTSQWKESYNTRALD
ncbi:MAG: hypothetical protein F6J93_30865 [Oscillatoria sp. SIO1A7]|nr:hypothetical protein [Oscillatoria sp. SIO1A7]